MIIAQCQLFPKSAEQQQLGARMYDNIPAVMAYKKHFPVLKAKLTSQPLTAVYSETLLAAWNMCLIDWVELIFVPGAEWRNAPAGWCSQLNIPKSDQQPHMVPHCAHKHINTTDRKGDNNVLIAFSWLSIADP